MGTHKNLPRWIAAAILACGFVAALAVNWPGHMEYDGTLQLLEGRTGLYSNWHPPVMSWLLGVGDAIAPGFALFVVFDTAMAFGALAAILFLVKRPGWFAVLGAAIAVALPQLFLFQAIVWKDVLFADACVLGFVCLAQAAFRWERERTRFVWLGASAIFLVLAALTRQNGFLVLPVAAVALAVIAPRRLLYGAGFFAACLVLMLGTNALLQLRATAALGATEQFEDLELYDLAGMMKRDPSITLSILDRDAPGMAKIMHAKGAALYTPASHDPLSDESGMGPFIAPSIDAVKRQWRATVAAHPLLYLAVRLDDFSYVFLSRHHEACMAYAVGVDGPKWAMTRLGLATRYDDRDNALDDEYAAPLLATPLFSHPFFAAIDIVCFVLLLRRRRPADLAMAGMIASVALYTLSYFAIAIACEYRYLFAIDLSAIAAALYLVADFRAKERSA